MSKMNELSQALDDMTACAENMVACGENMMRVANTVREIFTSGNGQAVTDVKAAGTTESSETVIPGDTQPVKTYEFADVKKAFKLKSHEVDPAKLKELVLKYGADKLSNVKAEDYTSLMADLEVLA